MSSDCNATPVIAGRSGVCFGLRLLAATALAGLVPLAAHAQASIAPAPVSGLYVGAGGGDNFLQSLYTHPALSPTNEPNARFRFNDGYVGAVFAGWGFGNGLRAEIEGAYDYNNVINKAGTPFPTRTTGNQGTYGVLANVFYDIDLTKFGSNVTFVQPYVGVGAGVLWTQLTSSSVAAAGNNVFTTGGTGGNFAGQAIIGLGFPVQAVPGLKFTLDYRFIGITGLSGLGGESFTPAGLSKGTVHVSPPFLHQIALGIAYAFNTPKPPPPPTPIPVSAPAPAPTRTYLVFFDWDRAELTDRARQIVAEAAQNSTRVQTTQIEVNGYTDLSGTAAYNQRLSVRRAEVVQAELVRDGVPRAAISIHGYGEQNPLVPTATGVREPQNRRVQIIFR